MAKKTIFNLAWYNILFNPAYVQAFNYISASMPNRERLMGNSGLVKKEDETDHSDLVSAMINLAYVEHGIAKTNKFNFECQNNALLKATTLNFKTRRTSLLNTTKSYKSGSQVSISDQY